MISVWKPFSYNMYCRDSWDVPSKNWLTSLRTSISLPVLFDGITGSIWINSAYENSMKNLVWKRHFQIMRAFRKISVFIRPDVLWRMKSKFYPALSRWNKKKLSKLQLLCVVLYHWLHAHDWYLVPHSICSASSETTVFHQARTFFTIKIILFA